MNLSETYPDVLFEVLDDTSGFIHYDSGVPCGPKSITKNDCKSRFPNEHFEY